MGRSESLHLPANTSLLLGLDPRSWVGQKAHIYMPVPLFLLGLDPRSWVRSENPHLPASIPLFIRARFQIVNRSENPHLTASTSLFIRARSKIVGRSENPHLPASTPLLLGLDPRSWVGQKTRIYLPVLLFLLGLDPRSCVGQKARFYLPVPLFLLGLDPRSPCRTWNLWAGSKGSVLPEKVLAFWKTQCWRSHFLTLIEST